MRTLYLTIGLIGSGKSTWAKNKAKTDPQVKIVSPDAFRTMLNGEYKYLPQLDNIITHACFETASVLLEDGYDVVIDCGNLTDDWDRRGMWSKLDYDKIVAVIMPQKETGWHLTNRVSNPHWEDVDWEKLIEGERLAFEPINEKDYDEVIYVKEF